MAQEGTGDGFTAGAELFGRVIREPRLSDKVAEMMRRTIISRELPSGTALPSERELGEQFGVSRTVIREAVRSLAAKGIVEVRSGSGLRVAAVDETTALQSLSWFIRGGRLEYPKVHEVRSMIEVEMAALAAERRTDEQLQTMRDAHAHFQSVVDNIEEAAHADLEFHAIIARATQNDLFSVLLGSISDALIEIRRENLAGGTGADTVAEHGRILERIAESDPEGARAAMRAHLETVERAWAAHHAADFQAGDSA
jgi:GntR family transcriptional regulator, transcriptional repressor for pyruvate dehydrogenase complex